MGTWTEARLDPDIKTRIEATTTYKADGTVHAEARLFTLRDGTINIKVSGSWRIQENLLITKVESEKWEHGEIPDFPFKEIFPGRKALEGQTISEEIVSVSDTHLITKDTETGRTSVAERKR